MTDDAREAKHEAEGPVDDDAPAEELAPEIGDDVAAAVVERFPGTVFHESHGQPVVYAARDDWAALATFLRDEQQFTTCLDVTAVDHLVDGVRHCPPGVEPERFEVVANFLSHARNRRLRAICELPERDPRLASIAGVYPGVDFAEREVFDLFGVVFEGHPALTRILMPDDWDGFPLRKDAPGARVPVTFKGDPSPR